MATPAKRNVIEYFFEGNTYGLESSMAHVSSILSKSSRALKKYQEGGINATQKAQIQTVKGLLGYLKQVAESNKKLTQEEVKQVNKVIADSFKGVNKLYKQALKAQDNFKANAEKGSLDIAKLTSLSSQASAEQHAKYLESASQTYQGFLDPRYLSDIDNAVADYRVVVDLFNQGKVGAEELASTINQLQEVYYGYNETLRNVKYEQSLTNKGIVDFDSFMKKAKETIELTMRSFQFWVQMLRKAFQLIKQGVTSLSNYVEAMNFLEVALNGVNQEFKEFVLLQQNALGLDPAQLTTAAAAFLSFGNSIGFASDQTAVFAMNMTQLAQDLASLYNTNVETMMIKLRSALSGQTKAMQAYGISVHDASVEEWLLSKGINTTMGSLSESAQAYIRYLYILEKTASAQGDLARTIASPANQFKILKTQLNLFIQNLGSLVTTFIMPFVRVINLVIQPLNAFLTALFSIANSGFSTAIGEDTSALEDEADAADKLKGALTGLDEINVATESKGGAGIPDWILDLGGDTVYDNMADSVAKLTQAFSKLGAIVAPIWDLFISSPFQIVTEWIAALFNGIGQLINFLAPLFDILTKITTVLGDNGLLRVIAAIVIGIPAMVTLVALATKAFIALGAATMGVWKSIIATTAAIIGNTVAMLKNIAAAIAAKVQSVALRAVLWWETAAWWAKAIAVIAAAGALALVVAGIVAAAVSQTKSSASQNQRQASVPTMATGGVVTGPTLALIGEGKHNEAVIPLGNSPQFVSMKQNIANEVVLGLLESGAFNRGQSGSQNIILNMDGRELARTLWPALAATKNQVGVKLT